MNIHDVIVCLCVYIAAFRDAEKGRWLGMRLTPWNKYKSIVWIFFFQLCWVNLWPKCIAVHIKMCLFCPVLNCFRLVVFSSILIHGRSEAPSRSPCCVGAWHRYWGCVRPLTQAQTWLGCRVVGDDARSLSPLVTLWHWKEQVLDNPDLGVFRSPGEGAVPLGLRLPALTLLFPSSGSTGKGRWAPLRAPSVAQCLLGSQEEMGVRRCLH